MLIDSGDGKRTKVSIRAPCEGSDATRSSGPAATLTFQSALPVRGAMVRVARRSLAEPFQSALPVRGAIHQSIPPTAALEFQSALPVRGAIRRG